MPRVPSARDAGPDAQSIALGGTRGRHGVGIGRAWRRLPCRPPIDWKSLLEFLAGRAIPGVEVVEENVYRRTIRAGKSPAILEVTPAASGSALLMRVAVRSGVGRERIVRRVRRLFDLDADPVRIARDLSRDPLLAPLVRARPGLRVPGAWDGFELVVRAILGQQISVRGASTLAGRLVAAVGEPIPGGGDRLARLFPTPAAVAEADLSRIGLPEARRSCLHAVARGMASGSLDLETGESLEEAVARLTELPGIGPWTAHYVAMRALKCPDAFPAGDLVLRQATRLSEAALLKRSERWRPWRAYATMHLWRGHSESAKRPVAAGLASARKTAGPRPRSRVILST